MVEDRLDSTSHVLTESQGHEGQLSKERLLDLPYMLVRRRSNRKSRMWSILQLDISKHNKRHVMDNWNPVNDLKSIDAKTVYCKL
jgi:hypothetical protein